MKEDRFSFPLGRIATLEEKLIPVDIFRNCIYASLEQAFSNIKKYFFKEWEFIKDEKGFENIFAGEFEELIRVCRFLLSDLNLEETLICLYKDPFKFYKLCEEGKWLFLKDFATKYLTILNIVNLLRIKKYSLKEEFYDFGNAGEILSFLKKHQFFGISDIIKKFYLEAADIVEKRRMHLLKFLIDKYLIDFFEEYKRLLLGPQIVFWYFIVKKVNLDMSKFLIMGKFYSLKEKFLEEALSVLYG